VLREGRQGLRGPLVAKIARNNVTLRKLPLVVLAVAVVGCSHQPSPPTSSLGSHGSNLFILYSANAPRDAPDVFMRYFTRNDYARVESLPPTFNVPRAHRYVLPTSLRERWAGDPGVRHWIRRGCGEGTPGLIVYDPEDRELTPPSELRRLALSVRRAAHLVASSGCHRFGLAPGSTPLFGLDPTSCTYDLDDGSYRHLPWKGIDLIDIQAQRLLGDDCADQSGVQKYASVVTTLARFVRARNPDIAVVSQVSFRDNPPARMREGIAAVADVVDGVYFSYPSREPEIPCRYCTPVNLRKLLEFLT
jgi:hypothetical protein